ncbi:substrate-binding periplasmic protein [Phytopseudomonas punonensis]|uniref:Amino acid ABC transporter substrate-binding protein, PAAT family n=1 Tax=Phytopseudomonas punonensis TaxID=1220495 RepID=A0A1M7GF60_9GAMM|nr:ABC transporter substrate-binding protein [Pseudomonas punonensis]SHM14851.1 amino acid ABC transporter substrate-binding protein, PAAT family [Pseudomonas punonensis]
MNSFQTTYRCDSNSAHRVRPMLPRLCALVLALVGSYSTAEERELRFSVTESGVMPMVLIRNGAAVDGILHDLAIRLAEKVDRRAELQVMPRMRVHRALLNQEIDVRCYVNPAWLDRPYPGYAWSVPFMLQRDLLVSRSAQSIAPEHLAKQPIGTVLGFHYPTLDALFTAGQLQRDDARTQGLVLRKLAAGRYDYAVTNELALLWFNRDRKEADKLHEVHELTHVEVACLVRDGPDIPTRALLEAMRQMQDNGEFTAILQRYR